MSATLKCGLGLSDRQAWRLQRQADAAGFDRLVTLARLVVVEQLRRRLVLARCRAMAWRNAWRCVGIVIGYGLVSLAIGTAGAWFGRFMLGLVS